MPKILERSVEEVRQRVDIVDVVERAGVHLKKAGSTVKGLCPFHSEKSPSFTVKPGKGYVCFGCGATGDIFKFVMVREGLEFAPAVEKLAADFGVMLDYDEPPRRMIVTQRAGEAAPGSASATAAAGGGADAEENFLRLPAGLDPKAAKRAIARQQRYELAKAKENALHDRWLKAHLPSVEKKLLRPWSPLVRARYEEGLSQVAAILAVCDEPSRQWPQHWMQWLIDAELVSMPLLPWSTHQRSIAFRVDAPVMGTEGDRLVLRDLRPVGYHQRFVVNGKKNWIFVPYFPSDENDAGEKKQLTDFLSGLRAEAKARGLVKLDRHGRDDCDTVTPPLPFVLGARPGAVLRLLVPTEGQWDAVTFAGALGWLDSDEAWPEGVVIMGSRGSTGVDTLLAYWGANVESVGGLEKVSWLRDQSPDVLVLADNDKAGKKWDEAEAVKPGELAMPTFAAKLTHAGVASVMVQRVNQSLGKDFNDAWKARRYTPADMHGWLAALGLFGAWGYGRERRKKEPILTHTINAAHTA